MLEFVLALATVIEGIVIGRAVLGPWVAARLAYLGAGRQPTPQSRPGAHVATLAPVSRRHQKAATLLTSGS